MSRYFVLAYRRSQGRLVEDVYETAALADAVGRRVAWEEKYRPEKLDVEVAILTAPTLADLQRTHARYFKTAAELTG